MGNPNPFYRFKQAWNAGFYPDNQIASDLLNEVYGIATIQLPGWATPGADTINQLFNSVKAVVNTYNAAPYYGGMSVSLEVLPAPPDYSFTITVKYDDLFVVDGSQFFTITGTATNPSKVIISATLSSFTPGSYVGTFDPTLVTEEDKVREALQIVDINGSAIFPITYSYDASTGIATSGLARAKDWQLVQGVINRLPAPTEPFQNQRTFQLEQLNGDDTYIISVMERIIQASLADGDYTTSVLATFNSFTMPDAYTTAINYPSYTTYERVQFDFIDASRRCFSLVGRKDTTWLWQRFVTGQTTPYDFLTNYTEVTALPYEVMQAGRWVYPSDTYDLEFVEFTSGCYMSPEFYAMPAKPGDQFQFNIVDGNLEGITNVNVGLFTTEGQFIQKIGEAEKLETPGCECVDCGFLMEVNYTPEAFQDYLDDLNAILDIDPEADVFTFKYVYLIDGVEQTAPASGTTFEPGFQFTTTNIFDYLDNPINFPLFSSFKLEFIDGLYRFSLAVPNAVCGSTYQFKQYFRYGVSQEEPPPSWGEYNLMWDSNVYECPTPLPIYELVQHQAQVTIPSKQGCYRMGLYEVIEGVAPASTCQIDFRFHYDQTLYGSSFETFMLEIDVLLASPGPYITFFISGGTHYTYDLTLGATAEDIAAWCTANIPGMICNAVADSLIYWTWTQELPCNEEGYTFSLYSSDVDGSPIDVIFTTPTYYCNCATIGTYCQDFFWNFGEIPLGCGNLFNEICDYLGTFISFRIVNQADNSIIYYEWQIDASLFTSTCPVANQDLIFDWLNSIPGFQIYTFTVGEACYFYGNYNGQFPCDVECDVVCTLVNSDGDPVIGTSFFSLITTPIGESCECTLLCEQTFTYTIESNAWQWLYDFQDDGVQLYSIGIDVPTTGIFQGFELYTFGISSSTAPFLQEEALAQLNSIPGLVVVHDSVADTLTFTWTIDVPCETDYQMVLMSNEGSSIFGINVFETTPQSCTCPIVPEPGQFYSALYSLSNIINIDRADCFSTILEFWSDNNTMAEGFEYYNNWKQRVRIGLNGGGEKPIIEESLYRQSNGVHRRPQNKQDLSLDLHTDFFDLETQLAMTDATRHPYLIWEGKPIFVKGDIEVATIQDFTTQSSFETLSQMKFQALLQGFQPRNSSCLNC